MAEPDAGDVEALTKIVRPWTLCDDSGRFDHGSDRAAHAILDSDWLAAHDAEVRRAAGEQIARAIEAIPDTGIQNRALVRDDAARIALEVTR